MTINKILCVDDEISWRKILEISFKGYGVSTVDTAENYDSGMKKIRENFYDLIILDSLEGDCFKICENIQKIPHGNVVILSGNWEIESEAEKKNIPFYNKWRAKTALDEIMHKYK